jgi:hypothetical protein
MYSDFYQGWIDRGLYDCPNHSGETQLSKQEEEDSNFLLLLADFSQKV